MITTIRLTSARPVLVCETCMHTLCEIFEGDTLDALTYVAAEHACPAITDDDSAEVHLLDPERGHSYCGEPVTTTTTRATPVCRECYRGSMRLWLTLARDTIARALYLEWAWAHPYRPEDPLTPEQRWAEGLDRKGGLWLRKADRVIAAAAREVPQDTTLPTTLPDGW